ncbi:hypothetical protein FFLO_06000 [Filobasidium floriforme]|uniref:Aminotransferase class I/classII large domain-containing protein n=1 Tax=Filobasidium floriforme TaxID=5210 RepID=A0A8K0NKY5_9TREE|nr:hypothetical protein FFLO_06000 [Filobasidium floriforme]
MEAPFMPNRKNKRKRDDGAFLQAMSEPGFDWNARVRALEDLLRTNPAAFADLDLNGSLVNGVSSLRMPMSDMPTADEQEMQNQVQAVISLINQAQAAQQQLGLDAQQSLSDLGQLVSTGPMLPSAPSMRSSPIPGPTNSVPEPLAVKVKVEENMSVPNSPVRPDRPRSPTRPPSASALAISDKTSESQPLQPPPGPFRPSVVSPVARSPSAPVSNRPGISQQVNDLAKADTRPHTPLATPPPPPPAPTNLPPGPSAATPPLPKPNLVSEDEVVGAKSQSLPKENGDMQVDTPPPVEEQQPPSEDVATTGPTAADSQTGGESVVLGPSGNSSDQPIRIDSSPVKAGPLSEPADQPMEAVVPDQSSHPQEKQQPTGGRMDEDPVPIDVTPTPTAVLPAKTSDQSGNDVAPKQEDKPAQLLVPQSRNDSNRNTGTLNIPANLQAELAKLAKGVQDSAFGDDMNDSGMDINMENILGDPSALIAQLASTMGPPAVPPSSVLDDTQNAMLMDMISHLANGGNAAQSTSLPSGLATPTSLPVAAPATDLWSQVPQAIPETNQQVANSFMTDLGHNKLNLGLSGFRQDDGSIFVPPTTRSIERSMHMRGGLSHDALPIEGHAPFLELGLKFAYGKDGHAFKDGRIAAVQAMSLTGALRIGATFLSRFPAASAPKAIYIPNPTVEEEAFAIRDSGLEINLYRFFDRRTGGVDWDGMREDIRNAPEQSIILLHVGGSTPTGAELSTAQWRLITEVIKQRRHIPFCIMEYQGLSSGNVDRDAQPLRTMAHKRIPLVLAQTFDAAMGLYSDSPTIVSVVTNVSADKPRIESQLRAISRTMHAHPPPWGAHVVANILGNETVYANWSQEVKAMADRLKSIRDKLFDQLTNRLKTPGNWSHIRKTQGMYCTTLLTPEQLQVLGYREHVHLLPDGCFSLGCLNAAKIEQLARAIDNVIRHPPPVEDDDLAAQAALQIEMALRQGFGLSAGF